MAVKGPGVNAKNGLFQVKKGGCVWRVMPRVGGCVEPHLTIGVDISHLPWRQANSEVPEPCEHWLSGLPVTDRAQAFGAEGAARHRTPHVLQSICTVGIVDQPVS